MEVSMHRQINIKQFIVKKTSQKRRGFALLYVMLFIFLILVTVVITWATSMAENRLNQRTEGGAEAYQLAKAALDDGWNEYHNQIGIRCDLANSPWFVPVVNNYPETGQVIRYSVGEKKYVDPNPNFGSTVSLTDSLKGVYDFRISYETTSSGIVPKQIIEGIGYYQGTKITFKGKVEHHDVITKDTNPLSSTFGLCISIDHTNDTLFIYQTGPSGN